MSWGNHGRWSPIKSPRILFPIYLHISIFFIHLLTWAHHQYCILVSTCFSSQRVSLSIGKDLPGILLFLLFHSSCSCGPVRLRSGAPDLELQCWRWLWVTLGGSGCCGLLLGPAFPASHQKLLLLCIESTLMLSSIPSWPGGFSNPLCFYWSSPQIHSVLIVICLLSLVINLRSVWLGFYVCSYTQVL